MHRSSQTGTTTDVDAIVWARLQIRSKITLRKGRYFTVVDVVRTLVDVLAASGPRVRPASRAVGAREGSSGDVLATSKSLHSRDIT
jgi:hypothetical protein